MTPDLNAIIEKLEKAEGELDPGGVAMIYAAARGTRVRQFNMHTGDGGEDEIGILFADGSAASFSENWWPDRSIDGAVRFVPQGDGNQWSVGIVHDAHGNEAAYASVWVESAGQRFYASAATPALALCIAALKARAA